MNENDILVELYKAKAELDMVLQGLTEKPTVLTRQAHDRVGCVIRELEARQS